MARDVQSLRDRLVFVAVVWLLGVGVAGFWYRREPWPSLEHPAIRATAIFFVLFWFASAWQLLAAKWTDRIVMQATWLAGWSPPRGLRGPPRTQAEPRRDRRPIEG